MLALAREVAAKAPPPDSGEALTAWADALADQVAGAND
jgi:hypothetical protein